MYKLFLFVLSTAIFVTPSVVYDLFYLLELERKVEEVLLYDQEFQQNDSLVDKLINDAALSQLFSNHQIRYFDAAEFYILNKQNSRLDRFILESGQELLLENLKIQYIASIEDARSEKWVLFKILELIIDKDPQILFFGWMSIQNLSVNSFIHYKYEIIPLRCLDSQDLDKKTN